MDPSLLAPAPVPFKATLRSLRADEPAGGSAAAWLLLVAVAAWVFWAVAARTPLYAVSNAARLEAGESTYQIAAAVDGVIVAADLQLGRVVREGQLLLELDSTAERIALDEGWAKVGSVRDDLAALSREARAQVSASHASQAQHGLAVEEAAAAAAEARAQADIAQRRATDLGQLLAEGLVAPAEAALARQEAVARLERLNAANLATRRLERAREAAAAEARSRLAELGVRRTRLEGDLALAERACTQLEHEVARRRLFAPAAGRIGELKNVHLGTFVEAGERLGTLVPDGDLRIVAQVPGDMTAKVRPGQPARFRFHGLPALMHGSLPARVARIASEAREGSVEVVLAPQGLARRELPLRHGVHGSVEIEIERLAPAELLLRRIGQLTEPAAGAGARR